MSKILSPLKVGVLFIAALGAFAIYVWETADSPLKGGGGYTIHADFDDATGLVSGGMVKLAGINIGEIDSIKLVDNKARITILIREDVELRTDAAAGKRQETLLGMTSIELTPGSPDQPVLGEGGEIVNVRGGDQMKAVMDQVELITSDVRDITAGLREVLGTDRGTGAMTRLLDNMAEISDRLRDVVASNEVRLDRTLANFEALSGDLRTISSSNKDDIRQLMTDARVIASELRVLVDGNKDQVKSNLDSVDRSIKSLETSMDKVSRALDHVESAAKKTDAIVDRLDQGEGTIGRLLSDEEMADNVADLTENASDFMSRIVKLRTIFDVRYEYHTNMLKVADRPGGKAYIGLKLQPRFDKYYLIEVIDDHRPVYERTQTTTTTDGGAPEIENKVVRKPDELKFSVQFARRFYFLTLRFGLIESTGGVGADLDFFEDALKLKIDVFDFDPVDASYPRLKAMVSYEFYKHIFLAAGVDDIINFRNDPEDNLATWYIGAGIRFDDEDLKALLTTIPTPSF